MADHYITKNTLFYMETALPEAASNGTLMSHMFLAHTCTYSSVSSRRVSLAVAGGIVLFGPDLKSQHADLVTKLKHTKTRLQSSRASCSEFLESDVVWDNISSQFFKWPGANENIPKSTPINESYSDWVGTPYSLYVLVECFCRHPTFATRVCWRHGLVLI